MNSDLMREGLRHIFSNTMAEDFLNAIDATGGWPVGYKYAGFEHTEARAAGFTNSPVNTGYWTVVATADDYYMWKLSPEAIGRIAAAAIKRCAAAAASVSTKDLRINNSRGYDAALSKRLGA